MIYKFRDQEAEPPEEVEDGGGRAGRRGWAAGLRPRDTDLLFNIGMKHIFFLLVRPLKFIYYPRSRGEFLSGSVGFTTPLSPPPLCGHP